MAATTQHLRMRPKLPPFQEYKMESRDRFIAYGNICRVEGFWIGFAMGVTLTSALFLIFSH
jgi:hypothetical protein